MYRNSKLVTTISRYNAAGALRYFMVMLRQFLATSLCFLERETMEANVNTGTVCVTVSYFKTILLYVGTPLYPL